MAKGKVGQMKNEEKESAADENNLDGLGIGHPTDDKEQGAKNHGNSSLFGLSFFSPSDHAVVSGRTGAVVKGCRKKKEIKNDCH